MLTPAQVIPFLAHENQNVRHHAIIYLSRAHDPSPCTADHLWNAAERLKLNERKRLLWHVSDLPQTERSIRRLLRALDDRAMRPLRGTLREQLKRLSLRALRDHRDLLLNDPAVFESERQRMRQRLELLDRPPREVWDGLVEVSRQLDERDIPTLRDEGAMLTEAIGFMPELGDVVLEALYKGEEEGWIGVWACQAVGYLREERAVPRLLELLDDDEDEYDVTWLAEALTRIGEPALQPLSERFLSLTDGGQMAAAEVLGTIKHPEAEATLVRVLPVVSKQVREFVAQALIELCCDDPSGLEMLRQMVVDRDWDLMAMDLDEDLLALGEMVNFHPPEEQQWRAALADPAQRLRERREAWEAQRRQWRTEMLPPAELLHDTIVHDEPKVGRNDPCPCGSGKKYKKCCLE